VKPTDPTLSFDVTQQTSTLDLQLEFRRIADIENAISGASGMG